MDMQKSNKESYNENIYIKKMWVGFALFLGFILILFTGLTFGLFGYMPSLEELENPKTFLASEIYSADQEVIGTYFRENRTVVEYNELPQHLVDALVATEDARFYKHSGIDFRAFGRVLWGVLTFNSKGGGSTISQQLAKMLFPREYNISKVELVFLKFKEWIIALKLEKRYTKQEIIAMYFNKFDFLNLAVGIKTASRVYFGKAPNELKMEESAMLVGMCQNPSLYNPLRFVEKTQARRSVVLSQMEKYGYINERTRDSLDSIPIKLDFHKVDHKEGTATYFREYLRSFMAEWCKRNTKPNGDNYDLYSDGLKIYTTINSKMQLYAEEAVKEHMSKLQKDFFNHWKGRNPWRDSFNRELETFIDDEAKKSPRYKSLKKAYRNYPDSVMILMNKPIPMNIFTWNGDSTVVMSPIDSIKYYKHFLHVGMISIEPQTGYVRAYIGGINYQHFQYDHATQGKRQVGSTFKPFVYLLAMQSKQFSPCSKVDMNPVYFELPDGRVWAPKNSDKTDYDGQQVTLKWALANSVNWISAYLIKRFSPEAVVQMAKNLGIESDIPAVPSICLGTPDISVSEMAAAHATFANKGIFTKPIFITRIEDKYGNIIEEFFPETREVMDEETAYLMLDLMKGVVSYGTGARLRGRYGLNNPIAGKTGTTQNQSDGWFVGTTPDLTNVVWVGGENRSIHFRSISLGQGANMALPIWALYMKRVYNDKTLKVSQGDFDSPNKPLTIEINCDEFEKKQSVESNKSSIKKKKAF